MRNTFPNPLAQAAPQAYGPTYYDQHYASGYDPDRDTARAQAIVDAVGLRYGARILDFGCGTGALTAACNELGYRAIGVDPSPDAIEKAVPEARGRVYLLGGPDGLSLSDLPNDSADLVIAQDVFEHVPENQLREMTEQLQCIGRKVLAIIPITDRHGNFVSKIYEQDPTHVTRLTRELWLGFFSCKTATDLRDLTPQIRPSKRQAASTISLLLEDDPKERVMLMHERAHYPTFWGRRPRTFEVGFDDLYAGRAAAASH